MAANDNPDATTIALYDAQVRAAWIKQALSDGTRLNLGRINEEQMFAVTTTSTFAVVATRAGWYKCDDGSAARATVTNVKAIIPNAGGHTHPLGRNSDILADMPGPEDGRMAKATGKPAYVISRRRAFSIWETAPNVFDVKVIGSAEFSKSERAKIMDLEATWSRHGGGSGWYVVSYRTDDRCRNAGGLLVHQGLAPDHHAAYGRRARAGSWDVLGRPTLRA